jgi:acyl-CoA synthetase (AMP-forming)/AMP-acid ligase II
MEVLVDGGVGTQLSIEENPPASGAGLSARAITEYILRTADRAGYRAALIDAADGAVTPWPRFAQTVRAAARGLSRRGVAGADTVGVFVQDAARYAVAVHSVRAAGAIPALIGPGPGQATAEDIAAQLKACGARLLITVDALAELATQAADRSWVRQVFAFGEAAEGTGATPFDSLLETAKHGQATAAGGGDQAGLTPADVLGLAHIDFPGGLTARLTSRDVVIVGPPCGEGPAYTVLLDFALISGSTVVAVPAGPASGIADAAGAYSGTAAIVARGASVPGIPAARVFTIG